MRGRSGWKAGHFYYWTDDEAAVPISLASRLIRLGGAALSISPAVRYWVEVQTPARMDGAGASLRRSCSLTGRSVSAADGEP